MIDTRDLPFPKPVSRQRLKRRRARHEAEVKSEVRRECVVRDGYCRLRSLVLGACDGPSEWAHLPSHRRSKTRGQAAEARHTTVGSLMACKAHHDRIDGRARPRIQVTALSPDGADGRLMYETEGRYWTEPERKP